MSAHLSRLISGSAIIVLLKAAGYAGSYVFYLLVASWYGILGVGLFALCSTTLNLVSLAARCGLDLGVLKEVAIRHAQNDAATANRTVDAAILISGGVSIVIAVPLFIFRVDIAQRVPGGHGLADGFMIVAFVLPFFSMLAVTQNALRGTGRYTVAALTEYVAPPLLNMLLLAALFYAAGQIAIAPSLALAIQIVMVFGLSMALWRSTRFVKSASRSRNPIAVRRLLSLSLPLMLGAGSAFFMQWTDELMVGLMLGQEEVGVYRVASRLSQIALLPLMGVIAVATPIIAALYASKDHMGLREFLRSSMTILAVSTGLIFLALFIFRGPLLQMFGAGFVGGADVLFLLSAAAFVAASAGLNTPTLQMTGHERRLALQIGLCAAANVILNISLIPVYGINGAALGTLISVFILTVMNYVSIRCHLGFWVIPSNIFSKNFKFIYR